MGAHHRRSGLRRFGLQFAAGMTVLGGVLFWRHGGVSAWLWIPLGLGAFHLAGALLFPPALAPTHRLIPRVVVAVTTAFAWVVLAAFYYVVFTPVALLLRLSGRDHIARLARKQPSWVDVPPSENDPRRIEKLY